MIGLLSLDSCCVVNIALGGDAVRDQLKVLYPATSWSRGRNPIGRNAMRTRETWNTDGIDDNIEIDRTIFCQKFITRNYK